MVLYYLRTKEGEDIPLKVVNSMTWGGNQQVLIYESPGTNGGVSMVTGRTTNELVLQGKITAESSPPLVELNEKKNKILSLMEKGEPIVLIAPIDNNDTGVYLIKSFTGSLDEGVSTYLTFNLTLTEYRQANLKRTKVNLISFEPAEEFRKILQEREITA